MKIQSVNSKQKLANIISAVGKSPMSWQGWACLKIDITGSDSVNSYQESRAWIQSILEAYLKNVEGSVYFCQNQHIHVFCKNIQRDILMQTGRQIKDLLSFEDGSFNVGFDIFDLEKDGFFYINETLERENGMYTIPISTYSGLNVLANPDLANHDYCFVDKDRKDYTDDVKVLLIEDDPVTRWIVRKSLKNQCVLSTAPNANQAFQIFSTFQPDIVFLDIDLPDQSGRKVLEWIMHNDPGTKVVMFSSNNNLENISDTLEKGASGFIAKPFIKEELIHYINTHSS